MHSQRLGQKAHTHGGHPASRSHDSTGKQCQIFGGNKPGTSEKTNILSLTGPILLFFSLAYTP